MRQGNGQVMASEEVSCFCSSRLINDIGDKSETSAADRPRTGFANSVGRIDSGSVCQIRYY